MPGNIPLLMGWVEEARTVRMLVMIIVLSLEIWLMVAVAGNAIIVGKKATLQGIAHKVLQKEEEALNPLVGVVETPIQMEQVPRIEQNHCTESIIAHITKMIHLLLVPPKTVKFSGIG